MTDEMRALVADHPSLREFAITYDKMARIKLGEEVYNRYKQGSRAVLLIRAKLRPGLHVLPGDFASSPPPAPSLPFTANILAPRPCPQSLKYLVDPRKLTMII
ncbi:hypothetical protein OPQ81_003299 [Rhizoctonia solani]|nr:hypothetical protein OPQ81_003299 [Rhizoctonia solani]